MTRTPNLAIAACPKRQFVKAVLLNIHSPTKLSEKKRMGLDHEENHIVRIS